MTDPIKALIAAGYRATMWLDGKGLSDEGLAVLTDLRSALNAIAAAEARPEPAAEPSDLRNAVEFLDRCRADRANALETGAMRDAWEWLESAAREALAREVRR